MELVAYSTTIDCMPPDLLCMTISIPSGIQAWITPDDYLPSGNYIHTDWYEGELN